MEETRSRSSMLRREPAPEEVCGGDGGQQSRYRSIVNAHLLISHESWSIFALQIPIRLQRYCVTATAEVITITVDRIRY